MKTDTLQEGETDTVNPYFDASLQRNYLILMIYVSYLIKKVIRMHFHTALSGDFRSFVDSLASHASLLLSQNDTH